MQPLILPVDVDTILQQEAGQRESEFVPLRQALGRTLRGPIRADRDSPAADRSQMDGFAVAGSAEAWHLAGQIWAGETPGEAALKPGTAVEIVTGALIPPGTTAVVPVEWTRREGEMIRLNVPLEELTPGRFIHRRASDHAAGAELVAAGTRVGVGEVAIAAAVGELELKVTRRPWVAILTTGDEVVPVEEESPLPAQVRASNRELLMAAVCATGAEVVAEAHLPDDETQIGAWIDEHAPEADLLITVGGMSLGGRDYLPRILGVRGRCLFHGVAQKPGKPLGAWRLREGTLAIGLPGNPLSVLATTVRYLVPLLRGYQMGHWPLPEELELVGAARCHSSLVNLLPVVHHPGAGAVPVSFHNSADFAAVAGATGFVELPPSGTGLAEAAHVPYYPMPL